MGIPVSLARESLYRMPFECCSMLESSFDISLMQKSNKARLKAVSTLSEVHNTSHMKKRCRNSKYLRSGE